MLYSIVIMAVILPFVGVYIYRLGAASNCSVSVPKKPKIKPIRGEVTRDRLDDVLDNINAYDGTGAHQKDVI